ncbi:MAG: hypothetical protein WCP14_02980 [bacterium]
MKKKDIITLAVSGVILIGCAVFVIMVFFPSFGLNPSATVETKTVTSQTKITEEAINSQESKDVINKINELKKYGETDLDNIGRPNPFGPL